MHIRTTISKTRAPKESCQEPENEKTSHVVDQSCWNTEDNVDHEGANIWHIASEDRDLRHRRPKERSKSIWGDQMLLEREREETYIPRRTCSGLEQLLYSLRQNAPSLHFQNVSLLSCSLGDGTLTAHCLCRWTTPCTQRRYKDRSAQRQRLSSPLTSSLGLPGRQWCTSLLGWYL